ncbi:L-aspartate semialdehyde sulfurtransferase [Methanosarcina sp. KYL-1]|uniref:L-aspartate semialdehyde sulfurtransferase n=1 Tax=Methanosarcina sp. KYL-1 TaxID=2602068 RepID=UPI002101910C|nr:L-aspartate semialdehyde sulfurtransferase [Methanosarcina sp. KYL-1]MCQ1535917.1 L-aspartate semialdehyde sulfurtransferase [Methanosarcina sp. KYL-1]
MVKKSVHEINKKIEDGSVSVVTAEEMVGIVEELGAEGAAKEVDVVTTGTFGAMCSSGLMLNLGHSEPPIKIQKVWFNNVEAYSGIAAVDAYLGAAQISDTRGIQYGGAHVIEDLLRGKEISVHATSYGTDCYPRKVLDTSITLEDLNEAVLLNPRNAYQKYAAATNSSRRTLHTYMGELLPNFGNVTYSGAGVLSPLSNDPSYETIGIGTRIFMGGAQGYVIGNGTQHSPSSGFGTLMLRGNLKDMNPDYVRAASFTGYGTTLYMGIGIPIPILNEKLAAATAVSDADIVTNILDYGIGSRNKPTIREVNYAELRSGSVQIDGKDTPTSSLSSFKNARKIANELKEWVRHGKFFVSMPVEKLLNEGAARPMKQTQAVPLVKDIMSDFIVTIKKDQTVRDAAKKIWENSFNHLAVVSDTGELVGILTAWDVSKAVAGNSFDSVESVMTKKVLTCAPNEPVDLAARRLDRYGVSAMPVIDAQKHVLGIITSDNISKLLARRY